MFKRISVSSPHLLLYILYKDKYNALQLLRALVLSQVIITIVFYELLIVDANSTYIIRLLIAIIV